MSPTDKHIDPDVLAAAMKKCNGNWLQRAILTAILANISLIIYGIGIFAVNNRLVQDAISDLREMKVNYHRMDKDLAQTQTIVATHEVRLTSIEKDTKFRN